MNKLLLIGLLILGCAKPSPIEIYDVRAPYEFVMKIYDNTTVHEVENVMAEKCQGLLYFVTEVKLDRDIKIVYFRCNLGD